MINSIIFLTLKRGIISQNCFWWRINDLFPDSTGAETYKRLKQRGRFVPLNIMGENIYLLTNIDDIKILLDKSPNPFGPGKFKKNFFDTFIPKNVGISVNPEWKYRRQFNDKVLETDTSHSYNQIFNKYIHNIIHDQNPKDFEEFTELTRQLTSKILFGSYTYNDIIYRVFKQADSLTSIRTGTNTISEEDYKLYREMLYTELQNPKPNTLMYIAHEHHKMIPIDDIIDQIPHWVFPIAGLFSVHLPRLLLLLAYHPNDLQLCKLEMETGMYLEPSSYTRKCVLELFRLNNAVNSTFRGLMENFQFDSSSEVFPKGTQFVFFNNPILRDLFEMPNQFIPSRWTEGSERSTRALMFNQGNQSCPGKELVISFLSMALKSYLEINKYKIQTTTPLDTNFIPFIINPCTIQFL